MSCVWGKEDEAQSRLERNIYVQCKTILSNKKAKKIIQHFLLLSKTCRYVLFDLEASTVSESVPGRAENVYTKKIWVKLALTVVLLSPKKTECYFGWLLIVASASFDVRISYEMMGLVSELELHSRLRFLLLHSLHTAHKWINYDSIVRPAEKT